MLAASPMNQQPPEEPSMSETYEILAVKYGGMTKRTRADNFMHPDDHAAPMPIDYFVFVIRNDRRTILVDTGFDRKEAQIRGRQIEHEPREILKRIAIDPDSIEETVITHLHFDHAGTLDQFPSTRFHLQEAEMAYATGRCMCEPAMRVPFTVDHVCQMVRHVYSGRVHFHDGDGEIAPGITVHKTPGHSKGIQSLRVMTGHGPVVLASDAVHFYENIEKRKPFFITIDVEATLRTYDRLASLAGGLRNVIPGHDPLILKRYPAWKPETAGIVHKLDAPRKD
jgi:glyoxylase-like metal-dependent hydrolase (beta-lactamase superfamily II)